MKKLMFLLMIAFSLASVTFAQDKDETAVRGVMAEQVTQWNKGDIPSFMNTYWKSDSLMFIGKNGLSYGWQKALENYKKNYPDTAAMGKLKFDLLQVKPLAGKHYFVIGKWHLTRSIGDIGGIFTLVLQKENDRWVIISDHTQSN